MERTPRALLLVLLVVAAAIYGSCALVASLWPAHDVWLGPVFGWPLGLGIGRLVMTMFWLTVVTSLFVLSRRAPTL